MIGSFSAGAKGEICKEFPQKKCCALAECFGILLYCNTFSRDLVRIVTEREDFGAMLPKLWKKAFGFGFDMVPSGGTGKQVFQITDPKKLSEIMTAYGFAPEDTLSLHVNLSVLEESCCRISFLRGAFLAGGSVTDPAKGYHMEWITTHQSVARETDALMQEVMGFAPKLAQRGGGQVLYFKQSDLISDVLTMIGAPVAAMGIMEAKLEKGLNNQVNRRCNCDDANTSKVVDAAQEQLRAIRILRDRGDFESLPAKLQQAVLAREKNPESSLTELAAMMEPPITKPAMSHRLRKLLELAKEVEA